MALRLVSQGRRLECTIQGGKRFAREMGSESVVNTIAMQVRVLDPALFRRVNRMVKMDANTLRLHFGRPGGSSANVDVHYNVGRDSYDVTVHKLRNFEVVSSKPNEDVYVEQLPEVIRRGLER